MTIIILDYHDKQKREPPKANRNEENKKWLDEHNISYNTKNTLLEKVNIDQDFTEGPTVLHLPIPHCKLNPIELAWDSVKGCVAKHNK